MLPIGILNRLREAMFLLIPIPLKMLDLGQHFIARSLPDSFKYRLSLLLNHITISDLY